MYQTNYHNYLNIVIASSLPQPRHIHQILLSYSEGCLFFLVISTKMPRWQESIVSEEDAERMLYVGCLGNKWQMWEDDGRYPASLKCIPQWPPCINVISQNGARQLTHQMGKTSKNNSIESELEKYSFTFTDTRKCKI